MFVNIINLCSSVQKLYLRLGIICLIFNNIYLDLTKLTFTVCLLLPTSSTAIGPVSTRTGPLCSSGPPLCRPRQPVCLCKLPASLCRVRACLPKPCRCRRRRPERPSRRLPEFCRPLRPLPPMGRRLSTTGLPQPRDMQRRGAGPQHQLLKAPAGATPTRGGRRRVRRTGLLASPWTPPRVSPPGGTRACPPATPATGSTRTVDSIEVK